MRIACLGGGPAGLYFGISMKLRDPSADVVIFERNRFDDTFGWGVVLSDETLVNLRQNDAKSAEAIGDNFAYWDDIALHYRGETHVSSGHGFCGIGRKKLLLLLQKRALELGVEVQFETDVKSADDYRKDFDIVVAADGLNSRTRTLFADTFKPEVDERLCQFVWLGTKQKFSDAFTFIFEETEHGWVWAHAYQFDDETATFIVECAQETFDKFGFAEKSQQDSWIRFPRVLCETWHHENVVLLGDASASAHFSIGSGTKLALESAISLAELIHSEDSYEKTIRC